MKKLLTLVVTSTLALSAHADVKVGDNAPVFELKDFNGKSHSLASLKGKTVVLEWLNHDCPFVKKHYDAGNMQAQQEKALKDGVVWFSIASSAEGKEGYFDAADSKKNFEKNKSKATAVLLDTKGTVGKAYGAKVTPHMFVIDKNGKVVYAGGIDDKATTKVADVKGATQHVSEALADLKAGKTVKTSVTKAYGCGVKYE